MIELQRRIVTTKQSFRDNFTLWANTVLGAQALAMVRTRIGKTGVGPDGAKYKPYSTKPTLIGAKSFTKKSAAQSVFGSPEKRRSLEWVTVGGHHLAILPGGYSQIRQIEGRQVAFKDFERTSEMWKSIHVLGTKQEGNKYLTTVGSTVELTNVKLSGNVDREKKEIMMVTKGEEVELNKMLDTYLTNVLKSMING